MYTSGTSGGSKAVLRSHHYDFVYAALNADGHRHDENVHLYSPSTACHVRTGICVLYAALIVLGRATITKAFSARAFWSEMAATGATHAYLSGATVNILMKNQPDPAERGHRLRTIQSLPAPADPRAVESRFGCRLVTQGYGSTECYPAPPQVDDQDWSRALNCIGRPHPLMEVMVADSDGHPVPADGETKGEILVRPRLPHAIMTAYYRDPEATARAFADLWYRTGDLGSWDAAGYLYFGGRATDTIRRRGENISAQEIEEAAVEHPGVLEAAAYGVPSELGEDDVKLDVILDPGGSAVSERELLDFLAVRLARWAVPRYIEIVTEFPRTATFKVQKSLLRGAPPSGRAYDRDTARA
jgi:crotonobetaine/carnitine-CoA ligase